MSMPKQNFSIGAHPIGPGHPVYFIADIGANHDGDLERAKMLIHLCKEAGAHAAKFQNFSAPKIVSQEGFQAMGEQLSHQAKWKKSVFEVYQDASIPHDWTPELKKTCDEAGIAYFSSAYDFDAVDMLEDYVPAYKVGSGDVDWHEMLEHTAKKGKPILVATGAASIQDVQSAVSTVEKFNRQLCIMQCNTNYTGSAENFDHIHLNVLSTYRSMFPEFELGLSDHTPGHSTVLGAVALGAVVVEKHFTDSNDRDGPDHPFAMNPESWKEMVERTEELSRALGSSRKFVADNEQHTQWVQRRCLRAARPIEPGQSITRDMIDVLRPATETAIRPSELSKVTGQIVARGLNKGDPICWTDIAS